MSRVSVIIPCYNAEKYIINCFKTLEKQTFNDFEVIIINDNSLDNTEEIIKNYMAYGKLKISYYKNDKNIGPGNSRNIGISKSIGEFIAFCDSDDWYDENYLSKMINAIDKKNSDIAFCGYRQVFNNRQPNIDHEFNISEDLSKQELLLLDIDSLCRIMIKRNIAVEYPIPNLYNGEDMAIIPIWIIKSKSYSVVNDCIYNYVCNKNSTSNDSKRSAIESLKNSFKYIEQNLCFEYKEECEFLGVRNYLYGALLNLYKFNKDNEKAKEILDGFEISYSNWWNNKYISILPWHKKIFLMFAKKRNYYVLKILATIHNILR